MTMPNVRSPQDIVICPMCGTVYERLKERVTTKAQSSFICSCGHLMARWKGFVVPSFIKMEESH
jgi:hypothetical protein